VEQLKSHKFSQIQAEINNWRKQMEEQGFFSRQTTKLTEKAKKIIGAEGIRDGYEAIREYGQILTLKKPKSKNVESFEDSYARHGVNEERYKEIYMSMLYKFYAIAITMVVIVGWMVVLALAGKIFTMVSVVGVLSVAVALLITTAFRLHQLRIRHWCTFAEWFNNKDGWWPVSWEKATNAVVNRQK
jgi:hypothetical protein